MGVVTVQEAGEQENSEADAVISPVVLSPDIIEDIAQSLNVSPDALRPIAPENITEAKDPTPEITDLAKEEGYEIIGKISTIKVDEPGYYYFQVTISDDKLWEQIASQDVGHTAAVGHLPQDVHDEHLAPCQSLIAHGEVCLSQANVN